MFIDLIVGTDTARAESASHFAFFQSLVKNIVFSDGTMKSLNCELYVRITRLHSCTHTHTHCQSCLILPSRLLLRWADLCACV